ncbi:hypothetical protein [Escherichia phage SRT8]|uniref:Uncharacterized protein n=1 Tax=Escherichia phage SRT8 TaxID=2496545 RepID=A0A2D1GP95_9CAUD|nr:hypothetical protein FDI72_gp53 [Escherichia phage SRT8]ATN93830.1 hypothetical protein [Escherichia phage SRT8]
MLKEQDIIYPITFISNGVGRFTFTSRYCGVKEGEGKYNGSVMHFVEQHNLRNPHNNPAKDYFYYNKDSMRSDARSLNGQMYAAGMIIHNAADNASAAATSGGICKIEQMPLGAKLTGVRMESGGWVDILVNPVRIEVDGETITFLLHHSFKNKVFAGEVSMKRGTTIKWAE